MDFKISLTGDLGSGKSTVCKILSEKYNARIYSTGPIVRQIAKEKGISVVDINKFMESDHSIDYEMDNRLKLLSEEPGNMIIDSRMAWFFTKGTFKVYLSTSLEESARRIFNDKQRSSENFASEEETARQVLKRKQSENMRYKMLYGADCCFMGNYDAVIDTTASPPELIAETIERSYQKYLDGEKTANIYMYGGRLIPTHEITNADIAFAKDNKETLVDNTPLTLTVCGGEMYIKKDEDHKKALAYVAMGNNLIPCVAEYKDEPPNVCDSIKEMWSKAVNELKPKK